MSLVVLAIRLAPFFHCDTNTHTHTHTHTHTSLSIAAHTAMVRRLLTFVGCKSTIFNSILFKIKFLSKYHKTSAVQCTSERSYTECRNNFLAHCYFFCGILKISVKGAVSRYSVIFCGFCASKNWLLPAQVPRTSARSAARTTSPPQLSRANVIFLEHLSFSVALPCGHQYFSHTKWLPKLTDYRDTAALT